MLSCNIYTLFWYINAEEVTVSRSQTNSQSKHTEAKKIKLLVLTLYYTLHVVKKTSDNGNIFSFKHEVVI